MTTFDETFRSAYGFDAPSIEIGHVLRDGAPAGDLPLRIPLRMMNRHGMIAGSTGTGKTRTLQLFAEQLSRNGVPVFLADMKGDLAGMSLPGQPSESLLKRVSSVGHAQAINRESAHEMLQKKLDQQAEREEEPAWQGGEDDDFAWRRGRGGRRSSTRPRSSGGRPRKSMGEKLVDRAVQTVAKEAVREVRRGLFGIFKW